MYVELLEGRYAGQARDIDNGTALDLIKLGRAKRAFAEPTHAAPRGSHALRDTTNVRAIEAEHEPEPVQAATPAHKAKKTK